MGNLIYQQEDEGKNSEHVKTVKHALHKCIDNLKLLLNNLNLEHSKLNSDKSDQFSYVLESVELLEDISLKSEPTEILKIFKEVLEKLYENNEYDLILDAEADLTKNISTFNFDLNILQIRRLVARVKNIKEDYENALKIFQNIQENILKNKDSELSTEEAHYLLFLISSDVAYTKHLLGKHDDSYEEYKNLYSDILKYIEIEVPAEVDEISTETYNSILQSQKYLNIINFNAQCLNILQIRYHIAYECTCIAYEKYRTIKTHKNETELSATIKAFKDALRICKDIYNKKEENILFYETMRRIAYIYNMLSHLKSISVINTSNLIEALLYCSKALKIYDELLPIQKKNNYEIPPVTIKIELDIIQVYRNIAFIHNKYGEIKFQDKKDTDEALEHFKAALENYEKVRTFYNEQYNDNHEYVLNIMNSMAYTNIKLGQLYSEKNSTKAIQYFKDAYKIYVQLYEKNSRLFGKMYSKTIKSKKCVYHTSINLKKLYTSLGLPMNEFNQFVNSFSNII